MRSLPKLAQPTTRRRPRMNGDPVLDTLTTIMRIVGTAVLIECAVITYISIEKWITRRKQRK
jgi:hypothetical protein